jgi:hypothetical protein
MKHATTQRFSSVQRPYVTVTDRQAIVQTVHSYQEDMQRLAKGLIALGIGLSLLLGASAFASDEEATRYCNPKVSKPCGASCILLAKSCHIPWTTSLSGVRKLVAKIASKDVLPKHVNSRPE